MEAFFESTFAVSIGEIGDKTQLLALLLAARYRKPAPIILGILFATLANHTLAGLIGHWDFSGCFALGLGAIVYSYCRLDSEAGWKGWHGIGDKTQLATVALAARYSDLMMVIDGTTLGMLIADVPAVFLGKVASPNFLLTMLDGWLQQFLRY